MAEHDLGFDEGRWLDYQRACAASSTGELLLVPGMEYADADNVVHTVVWGTDMPFLGEGLETLEVLSAARAHGAATVFAHPWRRKAIERYRPSWAPLLSGAEIWNRKYDGVAPHPEGRAFTDREGLAPFVALDFHTARQFFPLALSTFLSVPPSASAVVEAIVNRSVTPQLLGVSATRLTHGALGTTARAAEGLRRRVRDPVRRWQARRMKLGDR